MPPVTNRAFKQLPILCAADLNARVVEHYSSWGKALFRAYNQRYDFSSSIYERKLADRKVDERLIPKDQKESVRKEAIREAVAQSNNRMAEINDSMPRMIERLIGDAVKGTPEARRAALDKDTQRAKDIAAANKGRGKQNDRDRSDHDNER
jgi:hypothetical protein